MLPQANLPFRIYTAFFWDLIWDLIFIDQGKSGGIYFAHVITLRNQLSIRPLFLCCLPLCWGLGWGRERYRSVFDDSNSLIDLQFLFPTLWVNPEQTDF